MPTIPQPEQPTERGVGMVLHDGAHHHYTYTTPWGLAALLTPVFAGQEVISEEARVQVREQVRAHRRTGGVSEPSRVEPLQSGSQSVTAT